MSRVSGSQNHGGIPARDDVSVGHDGEHSSQRPIVDAPTPGYNPSKDQSYAPWPTSPYKSDHALWEALVPAVAVGGAVATTLAFIGLSSAKAAGVGEHMLRATPKRPIWIGAGIAAAGIAVGAAIAVISHRNATKGTVPRVPEVQGNNEPPTLDSKKLGDNSLTPATIHRANNEYTPKSGDLLPDVTPIAPKELTLNDSGGKRELRFSATWPNVGQGPLEISFNRDSYTDVRQRILTRTGERREVKSNSEVFHDNRGEHDHTHLNDFATYQLFEANKDGTVGDLIAAHNKVSFLITDVENSIKGLDPDGFHRRNYDAESGRVVQGMSVGWGDTYGAGLTGQEFDVSELKDGKYILRQTFDPNDRLAEANETNNSFDTLFTLKKGSTEIDAKAIGAPRLPAPRGIKRTDETQED